MIRTKLPLLLLGAAFALAIWLLTVAPLASQELPARSPDLIIGLYDHAPASHWLPPATKPPLLPIQDDDLPSIDWSRLTAPVLADRNWNIMVFNPPGSGRIELTKDHFDQLYPALRPGAEEVAYSTDWSDTEEIYLQRTDGSGPRQLTPLHTISTMPDWSRDGTRIAFQASPAGNSDIYVIDADGTNMVQLTDSPAYDGHPSWSPDGSRIVFASTRAGDYHLWIMNADGSDAKMLTPDGPAFYPAWSPDGQTIAFSHDSDGNGWLEVWGINPDGSDARLIQWDGTWLDAWGPAWSPDGTYLAWTETRWTKIYGQWYWTESILNIGPAKPSWSTTPLGDTNTWKAHWASTDISPPGPCVVDILSPGRSSSFLIQWSADDVGPAGIHSYQVQARTSADAGWQDLYGWIEETQGLYEGPSLGTVEFRCRARDLAFNEGPWQGAVPSALTYDAVWPKSSVLDLPSYVRGDSLSIEWQGQDQGSGLESYNIWVRDEAGGDWELWQAGTNETTAVFGGKAGHSYQFRSQAWDKIGHLEPWQPSAQATTTLYRHVLSATVTDNRGQAIANPSFDIGPDAPLAPHEPGSSTYRFFLGDSPTHTLSLSATGYGLLPETAVATAADTVLDLAVPPADEMVENGGFETGTLAGWSVQGSDAQAGPAARHTGGFGLELYHETESSTVVSQTISLTGALHLPTLSLWTHIPDDLGAGTFAVHIAGSPPMTIVQTSSATQGWVHTWADLSAYGGQYVTLTLELVQAAGTVWLDEVSLGSWQTPLVTDVTPSAWPSHQEATLAVHGDNFKQTPAVFLDGVELTHVTWLSATELTALAPPGLASGDYDLTVVNPGGAAGVKPGAAQLTSFKTLLPFVGYLSGSSLYPRGAGWPRQGYHPAYTGFHRADPGASRYALDWETSFLSRHDSNLSAFAVQDGILVAVVNRNDRGNALKVLAAQTAEPLWDFNTGGSLTPPSIAHGSVYFMERDGSCEGHSRDIYNGEGHWPGDCFGNQMAPLVVGRLIYRFSSANLVAHDAGNGSTIWRENEGGNGEPYTSPAHADGKLYTWMQGRFRAVDSVTGETHWKLDLGGQAASNAFHTAPAVSGSTSVVADALGLYAIDLDSHSLRWSIPGIYGLYSIPAIVDGVVYVLDRVDRESGILEARSLKDGSLLWQFEGDGNLRAAPAVAGDHVYVASNDTMYVLDRAGGGLEWHLDRGGAFVIADGFLYILHPEGELSAFRAQEP